MNSATSRVPAPVTINISLPLATATASSETLELRSAFYKPHDNNGDYQDVRRTGARTDRTRGGGARAGIKSVYWTAKYRQPTADVSSVVAFRDRLSGLVANLFDVIPALGNYW
jgi:hypothetical protein